MQLTLLVLRCESIEKSKDFYEKLGLKFVKEQHGKSPIHYSSTVNKMVIELYPLQEGYQIENNRLGFEMEIEDIHAYLDKLNIEVVSEYQLDQQIKVVIVDPDKRKVELSNRPS